MARTFVFTIDAEWSPAPIINSLVKQCETAGIATTIFATDTPVLDVNPMHEIALHPNINSVAEAKEKIVALQKMYPQAKGIRNHALFNSSRLYPLFRDLGFSYHSNIQSGQPFTEFVDFGDGVKGMPIFYMDHVNVTNLAINPDFNLKNLRLDSDGIYIFDFHPVLTYINCYSEPHYLEAKKDYHDETKLAAHINRDKRGVQDLLTDLLSLVQRESIETKTCLQLL